MEFPSGILGGEAPLDDGAGLIAFSLQGLDFPAEGFLVARPLPETVAGENAELDFRHIQPAPMLGGVVKFQFPGYAPGLLRRERLVQRRLAMGVQIVQDHSNHLGLRVDLLHQPAHLMGEVHLGAPLRHRHMPPAGQRLAGQEQVPGPSPDVLVVLPLGTPRLRRDGRADIGQQLGGGLIEADHRPCRVVGFGLKVQHILHVGHEVGVHLGNAPLLLLPRLEGVFFKWRRTASWDSDSTRPSSTALPASARSVQWS